jgi:hypothetical protein
VWDTAVDTDDNTGTDNTPIHGAVQVHDLSVRPGPVADQDWYSIDARGYSSYEAVIDSLTGDTGGSLTFNWFAADGTTSLAAGTFLGRAAPRSVFIRVGNPACGTACNTADQYTFRLFETTYALPRYNNTGGQNTVLILHNVSELPVVGNIHLFNLAGTLVGNQTFSLTVNQHIVLSTTAIPGGAGTSGVITISHNGRYGSLAGKAVVLDPATGFSFDTPLIPKP